MDKKRRVLVKAGLFAAGMAGIGIGAAVRAGAAPAAEPERLDPARLSPRSLAPEYRCAADGSVQAEKGRRVAFNQCWGCTTFCGVRVHIDEASGEVVRMAGNPYNPLSHEKHFPMSLPVKDALARLSARDDAGHAGRSTVCGRGAAMFEAAANPFRITRCLKRAGKRGENKWTTISFEQLVEEVVEGGDLFGEGHVDGLRAIRNLKEPANPERPEFGPMSNRLLLTYAVDDGRSEFFYRRFGMNAFGTKSFGKHGAYCGLSFRIGSGMFMDDLAKNAHVKPDYENCEFALFWGTAPTQAGNPFKRAARLVAEARTSGRMRYAVIDPVLRLPASNAARERAHWVPVVPGMDSALAMGMIRWIIENERYDRNFLVRPNPEAAKKAGEISLCNATWLVALSGEGRGRFLRAADLGLGGAEEYAVMDAASGKPASAAGSDEGVLEFRGELTLASGGAVQAATAFSLLREQADAHTLEELSGHCGVPVQRMIELARELTAHGKRAAVDVHGGMMSTSGANATFACLTLNTLIGNINAKGGISATAGSFHGPAMQGPKYDLAAFPGQIKPKGFPAIRCRAPYQKSTEFKRKQAAGQNPYPAAYPWYPFTPPNMPAEHLLSHVNDHPFRYKCWINWTGNVIYGHGGLQRAVDAELKDPKSLPLIVGVDTFHNETNAYADYLVPDPCMFEGWGGFSGAWSGVLTKMSTARWPCVEPRQEKAKNGQPVCMELFVIETARRLGLPGFGDRAIPGADGAVHPLNAPEDYYLRLASNIAHFKGQVLPDPTEEDVRLSGIARILPDIERVLPPEERGPVACVYSRGGRYAPYAKSYDGDWLGGQWKKPLQIYNETVGASVNSQTGEPYAGVACFKPPLLCDGRELRAVWSEKDYPFLMTSFKSNLINSYSVVLDRLLAIKPLNMVMLNGKDAERLGIAHGDEVEIASPAASVRARVVVGDVVMPGVVAVEHGFGHRALGGSDVVVDGRTIKARERAANGFNLNDLVPNDPTRRGASTLQEHETGASARQGIPVRITRVG
ncbi:molybdopterin dinucleotide binding domain-containing protein [Pseudodesulfovibrio sp.]|uniref:molybdopterin dinucleotide binding domain-containing protein n=1 Tax=Pseudodesulfovibrio sp. TaxID=2035812 RepID=UPI00261E66FE|nr:molybdopterin dinucleotide binding domain-containing protein [Pseudodesulfovibrio sp.]MDD3311754.1 molybdopterin dinucleotide binding domain-containing protein [Pseudodesulfovibrio sp.]